jgi:restriction system protein
MPDSIEGKGNAEAETGRATEAVRWRSRRWLFATATVFPWVSFVVFRHLRSAGHLGGETTAISSGEMFSFVVVLACLASAFGWLAHRLVPAVVGRSELAPETLIVRNIWLPWIWALLAFLLWAFVFQDFATACVAIPSLVALITFHLLASRGSAEERLLGRMKGFPIEAVDHMSGHDFEEHLAYFFERYGYRVQRTSLTGDYGADLVLEGPEGRVVVQLKRRQAKIGLTAVQEAHGARARYKANKAMVVTNSSYTRQAMELAESCSVELRDREWLVAFLGGRLSGVGSGRLRAGFISSSPPPTPAKSRTSRTRVATPAVRAKPLFIFFIALSLLAWASTLVFH